MSDKSWKAFERRVAKMLGGRRTGILGGEDIEHPVYSGECKLLQSLPAWLTKLWAQTEANCPVGKIPVAMVKKNGGLDRDALTILRLGDFVELYKKSKQGKEDGE